MALQSWTWIGSIHGLDWIELDWVR